MIWMCFHSCLLALLQPTFDNERHLRSQSWARKILRSYNLPQCAMVLSYCRLYHKNAAQNKLSLLLFPNSLFRISCISSLVFFKCLLKNVFTRFTKGNILSTVSSIPIGFQIDETRGVHLKVCGKVSLKFGADPTDSLHTNQSSCHSHSSTRTRHRTLTSRIIIYRNSSLARILVKKK